MDALRNSIASSGRTASSTASSPPYTAADTAADTAAGTTGTQCQVERIVQHLQHTLGSDLLRLTAVQDGKLLKVTAHTNEVVDGGSFGQTMRTELQKLKPQGIETVEIYKQKTKGNLNYKIKDFTLVEAKSEVEPPKPRRSAATSITAVEHQDAQERDRRRQKNSTINRNRRPWTWVLFGFFTLLLLWRLFTQSYSIFGIAITTKVFIAWSILLGKLLRNDT